MPSIKTNNDIPDIQEVREGFPKRKIKKVGIRNVQVPINVVRKDDSINSSTGYISLYTNLNENVKGSNMSRYRIIAEEYLLGKNIMLHDYVRQLLEALRDRLEATESFIKIKFDYFLVNKAPASGVESFMNYKCGIEGKTKEDGSQDLYLTVQVPYTSCCPCSKEISNYGAHNQRSFADIKVKLIDGEMCWIEDIIKIVEKNASAPIINTLKRIDESYQTEKMYEDPVFVEDMVRKVAEDFDAELLDKNIDDYAIVVNHQESIHLHDACAIITAGRVLK